MGIKELDLKSLREWVSAEKQKEAQSRDSERNTVLLEQEKKSKRLARVRADANYLQHSEVYDVFEACAQELGGKWNDVALRIVKPKPEYSNRYYSNPRLELTWNYKRDPEISRPRSPWSCDFISAEVDERNPKTQEVVGIKLFQDNQSIYALGVCVPVGELLMGALVTSIKNPNRRRQPSVEHPSFFKHVTMELS